MSERKHEFHLLTDYCIRCGISIRAWSESGTSCIDATNVIAISHLVRGNLLDERITPKSNSSAD